MAWPLSIRARVIENPFRVGLHRCNRHRNHLKKCHPNAFDRWCVAPWEAKSVRAVHVLPDLRLHRQSVRAGNRAGFLAGRIGRAGYSAIAAASAVRKGKRLYRQLGGSRLELGQLRKMPVPQFGPAAQGYRRGALRFGIATIWAARNQVPVIFRRQWSVKETGHRRLMEPAPGCNPVLGFGCTRLRCYPVV